jgi:redox-sensing transcriptional repressor
MPERQKRPKRRIPEATVARLPLYLRSLLEVADDGTPTISSERLAELSGVNAAKVRKDLSYLGSYGTRGVGYDVEYLLFQMSRELGLTSDWPVVIVGLGNLGHALANYGGFHERGFPIAALVDSSENVVGTQINGVTVRHVDDLPKIAAESGIAIGIIATPAHAAQEVADRLIEAGVTSVLNFAPTILAVPDEVSLRKVDLAVELQILSFYQRRKGGDGQRRSSIDAGTAGADAPVPPAPPARRTTRAGNAKSGPGAGEATASTAAPEAGADGSEPEAEPEPETTSAPTSG